MTGECQDQLARCVLVLEIIEIIFLDDWLSPGEVRPDYTVSWVKDNPLEPGVNTNILVAILPQNLAI